MSCGVYGNSFKMRRVARRHRHFSLRPRTWQKVEHITSNLGVGGSNPSERAKYIREFMRFPHLGDACINWLRDAPGTQIRSSGAGKISVWVIAPADTPMAARGIAERKTEQ